MRPLALLGWNDNTRRCLDALVFRHRVPAVVVIPSTMDATALRGQSRAWGIEVREAVRGTSLRALLPDIDIVASASWPLRISAADIDAFPASIINVHAAALPRWRGPHPLNWALLSDDAEIGVTVHHVSAALDEGDIILQSAFTLHDEDTLLDVREMVHRIGASLLADAVDLLDRGVASRRAQDHALATLAARRTPADGQINWSRSARECFAHIRASGRPTPGAFSHRGGERVIVWRAMVANEIPVGHEPTGTVLRADAAPIVRTGGGGAVQLLEWEGPALSIGDRLHDHV